jgi:hypothetical protein
LPEWSIDYDKYRHCPARLQRKATGLYLDDHGITRQWRSSSERRAAIRQTEKDNRKKLKEKAEEYERQKRLEKEARALAAEAERERTGQPARSRKEADRRNLETYLGSQCKNKHGGLRYAYNGECVECRESSKRLRNAMKRGAFPRCLTPSEKEEISRIYAEARRITLETGIQYHVDHIKPLSKGGEHHPDNLQIITAAENLSKGAKWEEARRTAYRNKGVGRRESI